jgi:hypothetical protein
MNRRTIALLIAFSLLGGSALAAKTYKYRCPKCKLIQEYGQPGSKKCPNDGHTMIRTN